MRVSSASKLLVRALAARGAQAAANQGGAARAAAGIAVPAANAAARAFLPALPGASRGFAAEPALADATPMFCMQVRPRQGAQRPAALHTVATTHEE
jgi:hypothetical protein